MTRDALLSLTGRNYIPGEPMTETNLIAAMISNGHSQQLAEWTAYRTRRGLCGNGDGAFTASTRRYTVRYNPGTCMFTYIGA